MHFPVCATVGNLTIKAVFVLITRTLSFLSLLLYNLVSISIFDTTSFHSYGAPVVFILNIRFFLSNICLITPYRSPCGPRNRRPHRKSAGGAGVRPDIRLPHHLQSSLWRRWSRHEGGPRIRGEHVYAMYGVRASRLNCILTGRPDETFMFPSIFIHFQFVSDQAEIACESQTGHFSLWLLVTLHVFGCVC